MSDRALELPGPLNAVLTAHSPWTMVAWLRVPWTAGKVLVASSVPLSLGPLALAFWQRNLRLGAALLPLIAIAKVAWSLREAGTAGMSLIVPAAFSLVVCLGVLWWALARARRDR